MANRTKSTKATKTTKTKKADEPKGTKPDQELTLDELEKVSGGVCKSACKGQGYCKIKPR